MGNSLERVIVDSEKALWEWLFHNHESDDSYLLVTWKKSNKDRYISRDQVLDALLAYGWIDGRRYALDDVKTMQLICKRKQQKWTQSYRDRIEKLNANGLMMPSGLAAVSEAQKKGTWLANQDIDDLICPDDLKNALQEKGGLAWWEYAAPSYKRNCLRWLGAAKKSETRQKRCHKIADACGTGQKIKNM